MPGYNVESGAAAFSNTLEDLMMKRAAQQRQGLLDKLAQSREDRLVKAELESAQEHRDALQEKREKDQEAAHEKQVAFEEKVSEKERKDVTDTIAGSVRGDIFSAETIANAKKHNIPLRMMPGTPIQAQVPGPTQTGAPLTEQQPGPQVYTGGRGAEYAASLPAGPMKQAAEYEAAFPGRNPPTTPGAGAKPQSIQEFEYNNAERTKAGLAPQTFEQYQNEDANRRRAATTGESHTLQAELDTTGKPTGKFFGYNTKTNSWEPVKGEGPTATKAPPGAAQMATKENAKKEAVAALRYMDTDIDAADAKGLIGPLKGRVSDVELMVGDADPLISRLATRMTLVKMQVDAALGGTRAAASPLLLKRWDDLLAAKATKANLHAVTQVFREMMGDTVGQGQSPARLKFNPKTGKIE